MKKMKPSTNIAPPRWPVKFLRFFIKKEYVEEIEGDMEELFQENVERKSLLYAKGTYVLEMVKLLRPIIIKNFTDTSLIQPYPMFRNYTKTSLRNLIKNPMSSFINIFGLSVAIGISLLVYIFLEYDHSIDRFHENRNEVYLVTYFGDMDGTVQQYGMTPRPLGEMLRQDFAAIKKVCRVEDGNVVMKYQDNVFHERVRYVDPEFLEMFTFPLKWGSANSLTDLNSIILSNEMSIKYFGDENPIGKDVLLKFSDDRGKIFKVAGVAKAFPKAHAIDFNFLVNFQNLVSDPRYNVHDWSQFLNATLIQVNDPADVSQIALRMEKYKALQNKVQTDWTISSFAFEQLNTLHERSGSIINGISYDYNREGRIGMPIIAVFMLALACFNYINIAIVSATKRLKEIGVRKVIGANRGRVIFQFLTENIVVTFFALVVGVLLGITVIVPWFVQFSGWDLELRLADKNVWVFLFALLLFTGIISGMYPAFYISKFEAVKIFKGSVRFGKKNPLTKIFLGIQLVLACITITAGVVFTQNNTYQSNLSWGYNQKNALYVNVPDKAAFDKLSAIMMQSPDVLSVSGSADHLGKHISTAILHTPAGRQYEVNALTVDATYFETMGLELAGGRGFIERSENDKHAIVVNELFVKNLNLDTPVGAVFEIDSGRYEIIGVLKDFHTHNFFQPMQPTIFRMADDDYQYLSMKVKTGSQDEIHSLAKTQWAKLYPEIPFQGGHQEDVWGTYFHSVDRSEKFNKVIATIAVLLASLGLYGLVTLNVSGRFKEFSIRKTLGAGMKNIASNIVNQYVILVAVALVIGAPVSYLFTRAYLEMLFAYPMPIGFSGIIISLLILIAVLVTVVSTQVRKILKLNPVEGLKTE